MLNEISDSLLITDFSKQHSRLYRSLVQSLNENNSWEILLDSIRSAGILCSDDPLYAIKSSPSPSLVLLSELQNRSGEVYHLRYFLRESNLLDSLALISDPETLEIVKQPGREDQLFTADDGSKLTFECIAKGLPPPSYQWYFGNLEIPGKTNSILVISDFGEDDCGEYYCVITQVIGDQRNSLESNRVFASLTPIAPHFIEKGDLSKEEIISAGQPFQIGVIVVARPPPTYVWLRNNEVLIDRNSSTLQFNAIQPEDADEYKCLIRNIAGELSSRTCTISVIMSPDQGLPTNGASHKMALLIGNRAYTNGISPLNTPTDDVILIAQQLHHIGFHVISLQNLTLIEMKGVIRWFYRHLPANAYAFFYFVGHGFKCNHKYMMPIDATEDFQPADCYADEELLKKIMGTRIKLFFMVLDMCLEIPKKFKRQEERVEEKVIAYKRNPSINLVRINSTSDHMKSYESLNQKSRNALFAQCLAKFLTQDYPVSYVAQLVIEEFKACSRGTPAQIPTMISDVRDRLKLTDPIPFYGSIVTKTHEEMMKWNALNEIVELNFEEVKVYTYVSVSFHKGYIKNALDFVFPLELNRWIISAEINHECLNNYEWNRRASGEGVLTIYDLQKASSTICIAIKLSVYRNSKESEELVDCCLIELPNLAIVDKKLGIVVSHTHN